VVTEAFSKRSDEIETALEAAGFDSYRARGIAARASRADKTHEGEESLLARWLGELEAVGWPARKLSERLRLVSEAGRRPLRRLSDAERASLARGLLGGPLAQAKAFTRTDVVRHGAPLLYGADPAELDRLVDAVVASPEAVALVADGGGRELAYVAMSRARDATHVHVVADDVDQAVEDLGVEWRRETRQRWVLDTDEVAEDGGRRRPDLARRTEASLRIARLRADAVSAIAARGLRPAPHPRRPAPAARRASRLKRARGESFGRKPVSTLRSRRCRCRADTQCSSRRSEMKRLCSARGPADDERTDCPVALPGERRDPGIFVVWSRQ
jgi:hypothetical protein